MAISHATIASNYLHRAVSDTVDGFGGLAQHLQNFLTHGNSASAKDFINVVMDASKGTLSIFTDLYNAPTKDNVQNYTNSLGNPADMVVTPGSNQRGHGGTAGFHADAKVGVLCAKAGDVYMLSLPVTVGLAAYMKTKTLKFGSGEHQVVYDGSKAFNNILYFKRSNPLSEAVGAYEKDIPAAEQSKIDEAHYDFSVKYFADFMKSDAVKSSFADVFVATFDRLKDVNGMCVHYVVLQDHGFATQTFADGVTNDIIIRAAAIQGEDAPPPLRLSHEIAKLFDVNALQGRKFRINGQTVDMKPMCPTSQPKVFGPITVQLPKEGKDYVGTARVTMYSNKSVPIDDAAVIIKYGPLLLPEHYQGERLVTIRADLGRSRRALFGRRPTTPGRRSGRQDQRRADRRVPQEDPGSCRHRGRRRRCCARGPAGSGACVHEGCVRVGHCAPRWPRTVPPGLSAAGYVRSCRDRGQAAAGGH